MYTSMKVTSHEPRLISSIHGLYFPKFCWNVYVANRDFFHEEMELFYVCHTYPKFNIDLNAPWKIIILCPLD